MTVAPDGLHPVIAPLLAKGLAVAIDGNADEKSATLPAGEDVSGHSAPPGTGAAPPRPRPGAWRAQAGRLVRTIRDSDQAAAEEAVLRLSRSRPLFAPLALGIGAFVVLFEAMKLLFTNWRLALIQVLPAMWIWAAMFDLKAHVLHGKSFHVLRGPVTIPIVLGTGAAGLGHAD